MMEREKKKNEKVERKERKLSISQKYWEDV